MSDTLPRSTRDDLPTTAREQDRVARAAEGRKGGRVLAAPAREVRRWLATLERDRRLAWSIAVNVPALSALLLAMLMPRGPVTAAQALVAMAAGALVGVVAGAALRSRWAMVLAPLLHVLAFELARMGAEGPTVDRITLSTSGLLMLVFGRGVHGIVGLLPMLLGAAGGAAITRRLHPGWCPPVGRRRVTAIARRSCAVALTAGLVVLAVAIAWPASTPPILAADGRALPGSVAELTTVVLGGQEQSLLIRGRSVDNPVLLSLAGGPGGSDLAMVRVLLGDLEEDFVVVGWDQRGVGKSYPSLEPTATLTVERAVADTIELAEHLRERFDEDRIYLLGESWGSTLGVLAAKQRPDLFHAFVGSGQMVDQLETDQRIYEEGLAYAARTGDESMRRAIEAVGRPPFEHLSGDALSLATEIEKLAPPYTPPAAHDERFAASGIGPMGLLGSEYRVMEKVGILRGLIDMFSILYPQVQGEIDLRRDADRLEVPVYLIDGAQELPARRDLALEWFEQLDAPLKQRFTIDQASHAAAFEHFDALQRILTQTVLPETYPGP